MARVTATVISAFLLLGAAQAQAISVNLTSDYTGGLVSIGEVINFEIHLDATEKGIQLLGLNFLFDPTVWKYNAQPNASVGVTTYILYGGVMQMTALYPQQDPWQYWPAPPPGMQQVNVNWADPGFTGTKVTGLGVKLAEIQLEIVGVGDGFGEVILSNSFGGGVLQVNGDASAPLTINGSPFFLPEPSTAVLVGLGLSALAVARRHRA